MKRHTLNNISTAAVESTVDLHTAERHSFWYSTHHLYFLVICIMYCTVCTLLAPATVALRSLSLSQPPLLFSSSSSLSEILRCIKIFQGLPVPWSQCSWTVPDMLYPPFILNQLLFKSFAPSLRFWNGTGLPTRSFCWLLLFFDTRRTRSMQCVIPYVTKHCQ
jgi:hypothetical protein